MKAIILAGGEGTRLRPLSLNKPKPMIRLFDRPLLEHIILLLRQCGYTELCMTLHYLPQIIRDHFGDGSDLGVSIEYRTETLAAGTAGSVLACADFIEGEDFLVISGDAACSFDLRAMMESHRLSGADATILSVRSGQPSEFGLVLAGDDGRIRGFVEKPGPERVVSDLINTGIYVLSPSVLSQIPRGRSADFGGEVFPGMLRNNRHLHLWQGEGYWNDVGSCEAYLKTCRDVLDGRFPLSLPPGQNTGSTGPCWVSPAAHVSAEAQLGPYTVIGGGSTVEKDCRISGSVVDGASLQSGCEVETSILSPGVRLGREVHLRRGCVLAENVRVGEGSLLQEGLRVWPGLSLPAGCVLTEDLRFAEEVNHPRFRTGAVLQGENGIELTPERLLQMGRSGEADRVGASAAGGGYARILAEAFLLGASDAGKRTFLLDAATPAAAAALTGVYDLEVCGFFLQDGDHTVIRFFDKDGLPLDRRQQRKLESAAKGIYEVPRGHRCHGTMLLSGTEEAYLASLLSTCGDLSGLRVSCDPGMLRKALIRKGAEVCTMQKGIPELRLSQDGFTLSAADETGKPWSWGMLLCALTTAEMRCGAEEIVLPYDAPTLAEVIAEKENGTIYRLERDGEDALKRWRKAPFCRDGATLTLRLLSLLRIMEERPNLAAFMRSLPEYHTKEEVLCLHGMDTAVLRRLSYDRQTETVNGLRLHQGDATATIRRLDGGRLRILAESCSMEAAEELCGSLRRQIRILDGQEAK
jgi:mannose-1-phosphate guanylyltransferase/phosphomannomutase